jgi:hypothetical protein
LICHHYGFGGVYHGLVLFSLLRHADAGRGERRASRPTAGVDPGWGDIRA